MSNNLFASDAFFLQDGTIELRIASTRSHYQQAFRLVHDSYCRAGLSEPSANGLRVTPYQLLPTSQVFVAIIAGEVVSTLTLIRDGDLGLPIESAYPELIAERRTRGIRVAEVSCLADRRLSPKRFFWLFSELSRLMAQFARAKSIDEIWIVCHPTHANLYERRLAFTKRGEESSYEAVLGNPAVPLCLDLQTAKHTHPDAWRRFFQDSIPSEVLNARPMVLADQEYFADYNTINIPYLCVLPAMAS